MTPEQRRAKYPLPAVEPLSASEEAEVRRRSAAWLARPSFTSRMLDTAYHREARLLATLDEARSGGNESTTK